MVNRWKLRSKCIVALLLCAVMLAALGGCGKETPAAEDPSMTVTDAADAIVQLKENTGDLGYENALSELTEVNTVQMDGDSYYRLQQNYQGIPVYGKTLVCVADESGTVASITGNPEDIIGNVTTSPCVTPEQVTQSICTYWETEVGYVLDDWCLSELPSENLYIFISQENNSTHLTYILNVGSFEFVVDAENAQIISVTETVVEDSAMGYRASDLAQEQGFPIYKMGEYYILRDVESGFDVYSYGKRNSKEKNLGQSFALPVESTDIIFGNTEIEQILGYEQGAYLLYNARLVHSYLTEISCRPKYDKIKLYYYDGCDDGKNAYGGRADDGIGVISVGYQYDIAQMLDMLGHEYCHVIQFSYIDHLKLTGETRSIIEGISDIYGEIIDAQVTGNEPDWLHTSLIDKKSRNIIDPRQNKNALALSDRNEEGIDNHGEDYYYSTVISHAGYLMWQGIDGSEAKKISLDDLAKLWYRAMLMMPADCDFNECRQIVELAATSMKLTAAQIECVSEAFDAVGITGATNETFEAQYELALGGTLSVYGGNGELYDDYTLDITSNSTLDGVVIEPVDSSYNRTRVISNARAYAPDLPQGIYMFTITDSKNSSAKISFTVCVQDNKGDNNINIFTNFGCTAVKGTVSERQGVNGIETNVPIADAIVTIFSHTQETAVETIHMAEQEEGVFEVFLPVGNYSIIVEAEGYVTSTTSFELTLDHAEYLSIILEPELQNIQYTPAIYIDAVKAAITANETGGDSGGTGALFDIDGNGVDELIMVHTVDKWYHVCSVYTVVDGSAIPLLYRQGVGADAGSAWSYAAVLQKDGENYLALRYSNGGSEQLYDYNMDEWRVYSIRNDSIKLVESVDAEYYTDMAKGDQVVDGKSDIVLNGTRCSYAQYESWCDSYETVLHVDHFAGDLSWLDNDGIPLEELYAQISSEDQNNDESQREPTSESSATTVHDAYKKVLQQYSGSAEYTLHDIDKDGVCELIVNDRKNYIVYTMTGTELTMCGKCDAYDHGLYAYDGAGLLVHEGGSGSLHLEYVSLYLLSDGEFVYSEELINTEESSTEELEAYLEQHTRLEDFCPVSDYSLLGDS